MKGKELGNARPRLIDKTMFIKEFIEDKNEIVAILRPRRFGKTTNMLMLNSFFSISSDSDMFSGLFIAKDSSFTSKHRSKYPVVMLDFKGCKADTWEEMYIKIWSSIINMVQPHKPKLTEALSGLKHTELDFSTSLPSKQQVASTTLKWLIHALFKKHGKKVIVLIDEYHTPLNHAFRKGYFDSAAEFFKEFYTIGLRGNYAMEKACLMGTVEVRGSGILSSLNNSKLYCISDTEYSTSFGFSQSEVRSLLGLDGDPTTMQNIVAWYNGYTFGNQAVVNPWSFINFLEKGQFAAYWVNASYLETLSAILFPHIRAVILHIFILLYGFGDMHIIPRLSTDINNSSIWDTTSIMHFLVHAGYLAYKNNPDDSSKGLVFIPNKEVYSNWEIEVKSLLDVFYVPKFQSSIRDCLSAEMFDIVKLEKIMKDMIMFCSLLEVQSDKAYHTFYFGSFYAIMHDGVNVIVSQKKNCTKFELRIDLVKLNRNVVFYLRSSASLDNLESDAIEQLKDCSIINGGLFLSAAFFKNSMSCLYTKNK
jgi:hypothetical protein